MAKISKRMRAIYNQVNTKKMHQSESAFQVLKSTSSVNFTEAVDVAVSLGVDPRKSDQIVRSASVLPHGTGNEVRVAVFAQGENAEKANEAGADVVGLEDLAQQVKNGETNFDVVIATPDTMRVVGQLGKILGPKGLMPNPKVGTVTTDVEKAVKNAKAGQVRYRVDRGGVIHTTIGKLSFTEHQLKENLEQLMSDLKKLRPATAKGVYFKKVAVSSTMGPGLPIDISTLTIQ
jgi:large subunit ribosomal protein L1